MSDIENLRIQQQINDLLNERSRILSANSETLGRQSDILSSINSGLSTSSEKQATTLEELSKMFDTAAGSNENLNSALSSSNGLLDDMKKKAASALVEFIDYIPRIVSGLRAKAEIIQSIAVGIYNFGKQLLQIPLEVFDLAMNKAAELANESYEVARAMEEVRGQFGDLGTGISSEIVNGMGEMSASLDEAGVSFSQAFGVGAAGRAEGLRQSLEIAKALGPAVGLLGEPFKSANGDLYTFRQSLGLTNEDLKSIVSLAAAGGKNFRTEFLKMGKIAVDMGKKFGISSKDIARDMAYLTTNSGKFGRATKEAMAAASVTVRSYGLELKDVVGILDQFADFESAATNASKLAQSFGAIIDPIKLMKEEDPAKAFEYLREQMLAAGQSAETMNKAQIKQLATLSGMDENSVSLAFSNKNVGKSYEQIQKEAEKSGKKQKTQQEIMLDLGKSIQRVVEQLTHGNSLMGEFFQGFMEGVMRSGKGRSVLRDLASLLKQARTLGRDVGAVFMNAFPGLEKFFTGLDKLLANKKKLLEDIGKSFRTFFETLKTDPAKAVKEMYASIRASLSSSAGYSEMAEGIGEMAAALVGMVAGLIDVLSIEFIKGFDTLTKVMSNKGGIIEGFKALGSQTEKGSKSLFEKFGNMLAPLIDSMKRNGPKIWESMVKLFKTSWENHGPQFVKWFARSVLAVVIAEALGGALLSIPVLIGTLFEDEMKRVFGGKSMLDTLGSALGTKTLKKILTKFIGGPAAFLVVAKDAGDSIKKLRSSIDQQLVEEFGYTAKESGVLTAGITDSLTLGLLPDPVIEAIATMTAKLHESLEKMLDDAGFTDVKNALNGVIKDLKDVFTGISGAVDALLDFDSAKLSEELTKVFEGIGSLLMTALKGGAFGATEILAWLLKTVGGALKDLTIWVLTDGIMLLLTGLVGLGNSIIGLFTKAFDYVTNDETDMAGDFLKFGESLIDGLLKPFDGLGDKFVEGLEDISKKFKDYWGIASPSKKMMEFGGYLIDGLVDGIADAPGQLLGVFGKAKDGISGLISFDKMSELGSKMMDGVVAGLEATPAGVIASKMKEKAGSFFDDGGAAIKVPEIENGEAFLQNSAALIQRINQVADMMQQFSKIYKSDLVTHVESVVSEINELNALLSEIEIGDVNSTIDSLNSKLLVNNKQIKIENKPININMNLNVQFDALKFTTSVFTVASSATKMDGNSRIANSTNALVTARDNFRAGR